MTQPESKTKLAEKLGFEIEPVMGRMTIVGHHPNCVYRASEEEIALWNLCLELSAENASFEMEIRQRLWMGHGHTGMYGDDGEMQCSECRKYADYKRDPLAKLREQVAILNTPAHE